MAKELTMAQIFGALGYVVAIVVLMSKHFKDLIDALPSLVKAWKYIQKKWFADAIFKKELIDRLEKVDTKIAEIKAQVDYNGGSSMKDSLRRVEQTVNDLTDIVAHNKALREITDLCSDRMLFKMNKDAGCVFINDSFLRFFGYHEGDVLDYAYENIVHDDDVQDMRLKWTKAINTKTPFKDVQRIRDCNGVWHTCTVRAFPVEVGGELREFSGIIELST